MKKWTIILMVFIIFIPFGILLIDYSRLDQEPFRVGDYVLFGKYLDDPILWRVIDNDPSGDPLLVSEYIISLKPFDAKGGKYTDDLRMKYGSNYWIDSNLRQWLNSSSKHIGWKTNEPAAENLWGGYNSYKDESGFLADGNFTASERNAVKPVTQKLTLCEYDKEKRAGGSEPHYYGINMDTLYNYDKAYYRMSTDKVFLLSIGGLKTYFFDRRWEYRAVPTEKALKQSTYEIPQVRPDNFWEYWLMDPQGAYSCNERVVLGDLYVGNSYAYMVEGVRPALCLDLSRVKTVSGSGAKADPCVLKVRGLLSVLD